MDETSRSHYSEVFVYTRTFVLKHVVNEKGKKCIRSVYKDKIVGEGVAKYLTIL